MRPLLRLVASNPSIQRADGPARPRHLSLVVAATPTNLDDPWMAPEPTSHVMLVIGLAVAGLIALATSIGRLFSFSTAF